MLTFDLDSIEPCYNPVSKLGYQFLSKNTSAWTDCSLREVTNYLKYGYQIRIINNGLTKDYLL